MENRNEEFIKYLESKLAKENREKQLREWGKLGGRPRKEDKKKYKISLNLTERQQKMLEKRSAEHSLSSQEFLRCMIEGAEPPNAERNKILLEFRGAFVRISNHFHSSVWTDSEKSEYLDLLKGVIKELEKVLKGK